MLIQPSFCTFSVNGERVCAQVPPSTRLIEFLRTHTRYRGPKLACGEGGCGACAVLCERYNPATGVVSSCSINACLATVGSLDGCSITTAEGLGNSKTGFHPIQDALARNFATQCGFCTPGITLSLAAAAAAAGDQGGGSSAGAGADHPAAVALAQGLDGSLCRCTGWRPIIDTCRDLADLEDCHTSSSSYCKQTGCQASKQQDGTTSSSTAPACCKTSRASRNSSSSYPQLPPFPEWLKQHVTAKQQQQLALSAAAAGAWVPKGGGQVWLSPSSLQQLAGLLRTHGNEAQLVSGNTGSGVYKELWPHDPPVVITTHSVAEMSHTSHQAHGVILGAATTIQQLIHVLRAPAAAAAAAGTSAAAAAAAAAAGTSAAAAGSVNSVGGGAPASTAKAWGAMADHLERIAGVHVRSAATLGGHFGLCASRALPTDLGLVLAAAGAQLQVLTVTHHTHQQQQGFGQQWPQLRGDAEQQCQQQQQQQPAEALDLKWIAVEAFLAGSAVGKQQQQRQTHAAAAAGAGDVEGLLLDPGCIAGAQLLPPLADTHVGSKDTSTSGSSGSSGSSSVRVVTAVWLPYADDGCQRFWSSKLSWRHVNSHAFVNLACWMQLEDNSSSSNGDSNNRDSSSSSSSSSSGGGVGTEGGSVLARLSQQADPAFAGRSVRAVKLFVGCPPASKGPTAAAAAADEERWCVLRAAGVEQVLCGSPVTVKALISALRCLEGELQQGPGLNPASFHSQALQGLLFKALVPLLDTASLAASLAPNSSSSSSSRLLRLLQLPDVYDPRVLPKGRQVLPVPPSGVQQQQQQKCLASTGAGPCSSSSSSSSSLRAPNPGLIMCHPKLPAGADPLPLCVSPQACSSSSTSTGELPPPPAAAAAAAAAATAAAAAPGEPAVGAGPGPLPLHVSVEKDGARLQASGEAEYTGDVAAKLGGRVLYLAGVRSSRALAALVCVDASAALRLPGVVGCLTAADVPGANSVFGEPLLAESKVEYVGQLIALVAAASQTAADRAAAAVEVEYADIPGQTPIITLDQAIAAGSFYADQQGEQKQQQQQQGPTVAATGRGLKVEAVRGRRRAAAPAAAVGAGAGEGITVIPCQQSSQDSSSSSSVTTCAAVEGQGFAATAAAPPAAGPAASSPVMPADSVAGLIAAAPLRLSGAYTLPAQQHMAMETQTAVAEPGEDGCVKMWSATQSLDAVQQAVARVLGVAFNQVTVLAKRLGGGFGGKASRSMPVAAAAALAATCLQRPVAYSLSRAEDFACNGGRCAGRLEYEAGYRPDGKVVAVQAQVVFRAGAYLDLAANDGATLLAASDSAYDLSGLSVEVLMARCNLPPHTIMRGPGYLQGCMVMEQILEHVAASLGKDSAEVKAANFLPEATTAPAANSSSSSSTGSSAGGSSSDSSSAGRDDRAGDSPALSDSSSSSHGVMTVLGRVLPPECYTLPRLWRQLLSSSDYARRVAAVRSHNESHAWSKRGIVVTPVRFDCAPAAVSCSLSVYADGSVLVSHGGIEMGQGLATKVKQAAVAALSQLLPESQRPLPLHLVRLAPSSSAANPNAGPTWSSTGSEGNCQAVMAAAAQVVERLRSGLKVGSGALETWQGTVAAQFTDVGFAPSAVMLSAYGYFDGTVPSTTSSNSSSSSDRQTRLASGNSSSSSSSSGGSSVAVQYSAFGAAVSEVELDVLTGERRVLATDIVYDCGAALNPRIDLGQVEGAFVMGCGVMLCEEVVVDPSTGALKSGSTYTYKIPTPDLIPQHFSVSFLADQPNPVGIAGSKASGEPALMTSTSVLLALQQAAAAAAAEVEGLGVAAEAGKGQAVGWRVLAAPATPQRLKEVIGPISIADALEAAAAVGSGA